MRPVSVTEAYQRMMGYWKIRCPCAAEALEYIDKGDSVLEEKFWQFFAMTEKRWHGATDQFKIGRYRVDAIFDCDGKSLVVELDGKQWHDTDLDATRDQELLQSVDYIIRIPYRAMWFFPFATQQALAEWFPRFDMWFEGWGRKWSDVDIEHRINCDQSSEFEWLEYAKPYQVWSINNDRAAIGTVGQFLGVSNGFSYLELQRGTGDPDIIDRIYQKSGCDKNKEWK